MGLDSNEIDQVVVAGGWTSVNQRPPEGRVQTMIAWEMNGGCELFCGTAVYRNGSYWNDEGTMLDTPSWWRLSAPPTEAAKACDAHAKEVWGFTPALGKRIVYYEYPSRGGVYFWDGEKLSLQE